MSSKLEDDDGVYKPTPEIMAVWPAGKSGNDVNGLGEAEKRAPRAVFWRTDGSTVHEPVLRYFYNVDKNNAAIAEARKYRQKTADMSVSDIAPDAEQKSAEEWTAEIKALALEAGADDVGICEFRDDWWFNDRPKPEGKWAIVMAFEQSWDEMIKAPHDAAYIEVMNQYSRAGLASKVLANQIRERGHLAVAKTGPMTEDVLMIPPAIEAGIGELGKHGSMIHRKFGSNFRLSMVMSDVPLVPDAPEIFGGDEFCTSCQVCTKACPPRAISADKQMVNGVTKWYVDFDACIQYFVDNLTCGICLAVCPWSRPGIADNLLVKMARRMAAAE